MKEYLGDGVYAEIVDGMVKLTTEDGVGITNVVYLEPRVMREFQRWLERHKIPYTGVRG